jgi:hypothetical protein
VVKTRQLFREQLFCAGAEMKQNRIEFVNWNERYSMTTNDDIESGMVRGRNGVLV